jgi:hypothetical protein
VANTLNSFRNGAVGFIDWLDLRDLSSRNILSGNYDALASLPLAVDTFHWMALLDYVWWPKANVHVITICDMDAIWR